MNKWWMRKDGRKLWRNGERWRKTVKKWWKMEKWWVQGCFQHGNSQQKTSELPNSEPDFWSTLEVKAPFSHTIRREPRLIFRGLEPWFASQQKKTAKSPAIIGLYMFLYLYSNIPESNIHSYPLTNQDEAIACHRPPRGPTQGACQLHLAPRVHCGGGGHDDLQLLLGRQQCQGADALKLVHQKC